MNEWNIFWKYKKKSSFPEWMNDSKNFNEWKIIQIWINECMKNISNLNSWLNEK